MPPFLLRHNLPQTVNTAPRVFKLVCRQVMLMSGMMKRIKDLESVYQVIGKLQTNHKEIIS